MDELQQARHKAKVCRHFSYGLISAAMGRTSGQGGDGIWEEQEVCALDLLY